MTDPVEALARQLCLFDGGKPNTTLGGDKENFLWHEYKRQANGVIQAGLVILPRYLFVPFVEAADSLDDSHHDVSAIWESPAAMCIDAGHLRALKEALE